MWFFSYFLHVESAISVIGSIDSFVKTFHLSLLVDVEIIFLASFSYFKNLIELYFLFRYLHILQAEPTNSQNSRLKNEIICTKNV